MMIDNHTNLNGRIDRLDRALTAIPLEGERSDFARLALEAALELADASHGAVVLLDGDTVVADAATGADAARETDSKKAAARAALRPAQGRDGRKPSFEAHAGRWVAAAPVEGSLALGIALDRAGMPDEIESTLLGAFTVAAAVIRRCAERAANEAGIGALKYLKPVTELERDAIELALRQTNWKKDEAARKLGISRASIYMKVKKYGLQRPV